VGVGASADGRGMLVVVIVEGSWDKGESVEEVFRVSLSIL
jgi:hypothetical protein